MFNFAFMDRFESEFALLQKMQLSQMIPFTTQQTLHQMNTVLGNISLQHQLLPAIFTNCTSLNQKSCFPTVHQLAEPLLTKDLSSLSSETNIKTAALHSSIESAISTPVAISKRPSEEKCEMPKGLIKPKEKLLPCKILAPSKKVRRQPMEKSVKEPKDAETESKQIIAPKECVSNVKRKRKLASEISRKYTCTFKGCSKSYG